MRRWCLLPAPELVGFFEGLLAPGAGRQDSAGTAGWSFPGWEEGRVKPELARIIGHFPTLVIASRCTRNRLQQHTTGRWYLTHATAQRHQHAACAQQAPEKQNPVAWTGLVNSGCGDRI